MTQQALWIDAIEDALKADCAAIGPKVIAHTLWPEKGVESATRYLNDCLNPDRNQKLDPAQVSLIIKMAKAAGSYVTIYYLCDEASMTKPTPIEPEDEKVKLHKEVIKAVANLEGLVGRLEGLK